MNDATWIGIVTLVCGMILNIVTSVLAYLKARDAAELGTHNAIAIKENTEKQAEIGDHVAQVGQQINGRVKELIDEIRRSAALAIGKAHADGMIAGVAAQEIRSEKTASDILTASQLRHDQANPPDEHPARSNP